MKLSDITATYVYFFLMGNFDSEKIDAWNINSKEKKKKVN